MALRGFEGFAHDFAERFGEKILAVFVEAEEEVFHRCFVHGHQFGRGEERRIERFCAACRPANLQAAPGEMSSRRIDKKRAGIDNRFAFQIDRTRCCAGDRVDIRFGSAVDLWCFIT